MKSVVFAAVATLACATPAFAQAPSGARIEADFGFDRVADAIGSGVSVTKGGFTYGGTLGYDVPLDENAVSVGIDLSATGSTTRVSYLGGTIKVGRDLYAGGRITVPVSRHTNLYAIVGYANGQLIYTNGGLRASQNGDGVRYGAGVQVDVGHNGYVGFQWDRTDYEYGISRERALVTSGVHF